MTDGLGSAEAVAAAPGAVVGVDGSDLTLAIPAVPILLEIVCRATRMGFAAIARIEGDRWIACAVRDEISLGLGAGTVVALATTLCHEARLTREPVVIEDIEIEPPERRRATPVRHGVRSHVSVPIARRTGEFFGTLCAMDRERRTIDTARIRELCRLVAELVALHLDTQNRIAAGEEALSSERTVSGLREQFIAVLGHDLRGPVASVGSGIRLLLRQPDRLPEIAIHMQRSLLRITGLIDNVLDFARGRLGGGLALERDADRPVAETLLEVVQEQQSIHPEQRIALEIAIGEQVSCHRGRVAQVLSNFLANALHHGDAAHPIRVSARAERGMFELAVSNAGPPIPPAMLATLFQPFVRGDAGGGGTGLGLGLYIASEIAKAHGGTVTATSSEAETRFAMRFPSRDPAQGG